MEEIFTMIGTLIVLAILIVPMVIIIGYVAVVAIIAIGAIIPMTISFCIGFLVKGVYRVITYVPPRRAIVE